GGGSVKAEFEKKTNSEIFPEKDGLMPTLKVASRWNCASIGMVPACDLRHPIRRRFPKGVFRALRFSGGYLCDRAGKGVQRLERVSRRRSGVSPASRGYARAQRPRTDGASMCERRPVVSHHAGGGCGRAAAAGNGNARGVHPSLCGRQRQAPGGGAIAR